MKGELTHIHDSMAQLSRQMMEFLHHHAETQRGHYQAPTLFTKMVLPRFMKEYVVGSLSKCESYFYLDKTPEERKVSMVSLVLDEAGYRWCDGLKNSSQDPISWRVFSEGICIQFHATIQRPLEELVQLK